jgi:hypothetical protein
LRFRKKNPAVPVAQKMAGVPAAKKMPSIFGCEENGRDDWI